MLVSASPQKINWSLQKVGKIISFLWQQIASGTKKIGENLYALIRSFFSIFSFYLSIYLAIQLSSYLAIQLPIYLSIYLSIYPSIYLDPPSTNKNCVLPMYASICSPFLVVFQGSRSRYGIISNVNVQKNQENNRGLKWMEAEN